MQHANWNVAGFRSKFLVGVPELWVGSSENKTQSFGFGLFRCRLFGLRRGPGDRLDHSAFDVFSNPGADRFRSNGDDRDRAKFFEGMVFL